MIQSSVCKNVALLLMTSVLWSCGPRSLIKVTDEFTYIPPSTSDVSGGTEIGDPSLVTDPQDEVNPPAENTPPTVTPVEIPAPTTTTDENCTVRTVDSKFVQTCSDGSVVIIVPGTDTPPSPLVNIINTCGVHGNETWLQFANGEMIGNLEGEEVFLELIAPGITHTIHERHCRYSVTRPVSN